MTMDAEYHNFGFLATFGEAARMKGVPYGNDPRPATISSEYLCTMYTISTKHHRGPTMSQTETVTIRLPSEVKDKLASLAISTNRSKSWLAAQAIAAYVEEQSWQIQQIEAAVALADSDNAEWVSGTEVDAWLTSWGTDNERSAPCG
jgi:RHH-type transcriptional regulator, rel operon repressor / antitoxin RelB